MQLMYYSRIHRTFFFSGKFSEIEHFCARQPFQKNLSARTRIIVLPRSIFSWPTWLAFNTRLSRNPSQVYGFV